MNQKPTNTTFSNRRASLCSELDEGAILISANTLVLRNHDVEYQFRQESSFWYFTGFNEPNAVALLRPNHEDPYVLFFQPTDEKSRLWTRKGITLDIAKNEYGADEAYPIDELNLKLPTLLKKNKNIYYSLGSNSNLDKVVLDIVKNRRSTVRHADDLIEKVIDPYPIISAMRLLKTESEIQLISDAINITIDGFESGIKATKPGLYEYQIQATIEHAFRKNGSFHNAYPSIVASGNNACILHYTENDSLLSNDSLLLVDAGAEIKYYAADITRTWPVNGKFSEIQRDIYDIVLTAQKDAISIIKPGIPFSDIHKKALQTLVQGLIDLRILSGNISDNIESKTYLPYFAHGISHWLGLDVHDIGSYTDKIGSKILKPGMVFTVEPGLYFNNQNSSTPQKYAGIGIRIEDDILVTDTGHQNLTAKLPVNPSDIEHLML